MNRIILILKFLFISFFIIFQNTVNAEDDFIFRKVKWGYSLQDVIESELPNKSYRVGDNFILYKGNMANRECNIKYNFTNNDKLYKISVFFDIKNKYDRSEFLKYIYGIFKDKYKESEESGILGDVCLSFENNLTEIFIMTTNNNLTIMYTEKGYANKEKEERKRKWDNMVNELKEKREKDLKEF